MLERFLEAYDAVLVLDTETTGISCRNDEIIELAVLKAGQADGALCELETMDEEEPEDETGEEFVDWAERHEELEDLADEIVEQLEALGERVD